MIAYPGLRFSKSSRLLILSASSSLTSMHITFQSVSPSSIMARIPRALTLFWFKICSDYNVFAQNDFIIGWTYDMNQFLEWLHHGLVLWNQFHKHRLDHCHHLLWCWHQYVLGFPMFVGYIRSSMDNPFVGRRWQHIEGYLEIMLAMVTWEWKMNH